MRKTTIRTKLTALAIVGAIGITGTLAGCSASEYEQRKTLQKSTTLTNSLEKQNLQEKLKREDDPDSIRYVYVMNFGQVVGYYVTKGKISSNGSQVAPEEEVVRGYGGDGYILDSAQDDGSYGDGDPGIFFFTTDGVMVVTSLDYIQSDSPLAIDVPRLGGDETAKK